SSSAVRPAPASCRPPSSVLRSPPAAQRPAPTPCLLAPFVLTSLACYTQSRIPPHLGSSMEQSIYLNGAFVSRSEAKVSVFDHGYLYGDGVFEGIRAYDGRVFRLQEHVERLFHSARGIMLAIPDTPEEIRDIVLETCRRNGIESGYIRVVVSRGPGDLGIDPRNCPGPGTGG